MTSHELNIASDEGILCGQRRNYVS